jgi:acyl-CoA thioesterase FadM
MLGHMNNAVYIQYLQEATQDALGVGNNAAGRWHPVSLIAEYRAPAHYGDELALSAWPLGVDGSRLVSGYQIVQAPDGSLVLSAQIEWSCQNEGHGTGCAAPEARLSVMTTGPAQSPVKPFMPPGDSGARPFR